MTTTCTTCNRPVTSPTRRFDDRGRVVQGCVDDSHTGHLMVPSESARWHDRPAARAIRRNNPWN